MSRSPRKPTGEDPTYIGVINGFETDRTIYDVWADFERKLMWVVWELSLGSSSDTEEIWDFNCPPSSENTFWYHVWNMVKAFKEDMEDPSVSPNSRWG